MENVEKNIKPALRAGKVVVLDRYYFSTMAYQGARGIDPEMIKQLNESFVVRPDLVFILDILPSEGLRRIEKNRPNLEEHFEKEDYLVKVREIFRSIEGKNIHHLDASRSEEAVYTGIEKTVFDFLKDDL